MRRMGKAGRSSRDRNGSSQSQEPGGISCRFQLASRSWKLRNIPMYDTSTADDRRWAALVSRDAAADGLFYSCVRTTGVYCRPSCPGRPRRNNVFFVETRTEAERAGLRPCKRCRPDRLAVGPIARRIDAIDWERADEGLERDGFAALGRLLDDNECAGLAAAYAADGDFRTKVVMARHAFGAGEYKYFADPPPAPVEDLRTRLYARLSPLANRWGERLGEARTYPPDHSAYRAICAAAGQTRPTPLLLSYGPGDYNRLHRDLYGAEIFPVQVAILLSEPGKDFEGGEFILTEQRPRMQSRAHVVPLAKGDAVAFAVNERPIDGARGVYKARMRHGVSTIRAGRRMTLGVIFHDAE